MMDHGKTSNNHEVIGSLDNDMLLQNILIISNLN